MARTALTPVVLTANTVVADPAGTALDATNDHYFTATEPTHEYVIRVTNTTSTTKTVQLKAGDNPPADASGQGDLTLSLTDGSSTPTTKWYGPFSSARFLQNDGTVSIDVDASMTGTITVFRIPRNA
jgi:hypothetical protein